MKAVILAVGRGTRIKQEPHLQPKLGSPNFAEFVDKTSIDALGTMTNAKLSDHYSSASVLALPIIQECF